MKGAGEKSLICSLALLPPIFDFSLSLRAGGGGGGGDEWRRKLVSGCDDLMMMNGWMDDC